MTRPLYVVADTYEGCAINEDSKKIKKNLNKDPSKNKIEFISVKCYQITMQIIIYVSLLLLWSSPSFPMDNSEINLQDFAPTSPFATVPKIYSYEDIADTILVKDVSRVRSQDDLNTCYACAASTVLTSFFCANHPSYASLNCKELPLEMQVAQYDMVSRARTNRPGQQKGRPSNHTNLAVKPIDGQKIGALDSLQNSQSVFSFNSEACVPFDRLVEYTSKLPNKPKNDITGFIERLQKYHSEADAGCTKCLEEINSVFKNNMSQSEYQKALVSDNNFYEFLYLLVYNKPCEKKLSFQKSPSVEFYPKLDQKISAKNSLLSNLREALGDKNENRPVILDFLCLYKNRITGACLSHSIVITGIKKVCTDKDFKRDCKQKVRVQNCYGQEWQSKHSDPNESKDDTGWVDADNLLQHVSMDLTHHNPGTISWLKKRSN